MIKKILALNDNGNSDKDERDPSQKNLEEIFDFASKSECPARFLRLGGPQEFRTEVIAVHTETSHASNKAYKLLMDKKIPEIEFILNNPFSEPFLSRMDAEKRVNWKIWRVKDQVLDFALGLISINNHRKQHKPALSNIKVAFHNVDLIWNIGIAEGNHVIVRSYYGSNKGHDDKNSTEEKIKSFHLTQGNPDRLAESFESYYKSVKNDSRTNSAYFEKDLVNVGVWPSLFKGNAILTSSDVSSTLINSESGLPLLKDGQEIEYNGQSFPRCKIKKQSSKDNCDWVEKACSSDFGQNAEQTWYSLQVPKTNYLKSTGHCRNFKLKKPFKGVTTCMHWINGVTAAELLWILEEIKEISPKLIPKLGVLSGAITIQAFRALDEFRDTIKKNTKNGSPLKEKTKRYPWSQQLGNAILEAGRFVLDNKQKLHECEKEAYQLGSSLEEYENFAFRDASLKNRIIQLDENFEKDNYLVLRNRLTDSTPKEIFLWLKSVTYDIDFETCFWNVTQWDDPLHILWSSNFGYKNVDELMANLDSLKKWGWTPCPPEELHEMWMTILCRSFREYCRRLWYDHIMPITYQRRYSKERRDLFLDLSLCVSKKVAGCDYIKELIDNCVSSGDSIWNHKHEENNLETIQAVFPKYDIDSFESSSPKRPREEKTGKISINAVPPSKMSYIDDASKLRNFSTEIEHILEKNPNISESLKKYLDRLKDMQSNVEALRESENDTDFNDYQKKYQQNSEELLFEMLDEMIKQTKNDNEKLTLRKIKSKIVENKEVITLFLEWATRFFPK